MLLRVRQLPLTHRKPGVHQRMRPRHPHPQGARRDPSYQNPSQGNCHKKKHKTENGCSDRQCPIKKEHSMRRSQTQLHEVKRHETLRGLVLCARCESSPFSAAPNPESGVRP